MREYGAFPVQKNDKVNSMTPKDVISLMRPKHWVKNVLIFVPALFGGAARR